MRFRRFRFGRRGRLLRRSRLGRLPVSLGNDLVGLLLLDGLGEGLLKLILFEGVVVFQVNFHTGILQSIVGLVSDDLVLGVVVERGRGGIWINSKNSDDANNSNENGAGCCDDSLSVRIPTTGDVADKTT